MEKERFVLDQERVMALTAQLAVDAIANLGEASYRVGESMTRQTLHERGTGVAAFKEAIKGAVEESDNTRQDIVSVFSLDMAEALKELKHPDDILQVKQAIDAKTAVLKKNNEGASRIIHTYKNEAEAIVENQASEGNKVIDVTLADLRTRVDDKNPGLASYLNKIKIATDLLEQKIDTKDEVLKQLSDRKLRALEELIKRQDHSTYSLSIRSKASIESFIDRIKLSRATTENRDQQSRQGSGGRNTNNNSWGSSSRDDDFYGRRAQPNNGQNGSRDPRIDRLMGRNPDQDRKPYQIFVANVDHHRSAGKTDQQIYRLLMKNFHPDRSEHSRAEDVARVLSSAYDKETKKFSI